MFQGLTKQDRDFIERISATAIANQAILKCSAAGLPVTIDNVIYFVGDFFNPDDPDAENLVAHIAFAIEEVVGAIVFAPKPMPFKLVKS